MFVKPNLFVVGAAKAGTTSMHSLLSQHPDILMSSEKEPMFFNDTKSSAKKTKSIEEYMSCFEAWEHQKIVGEASPSYLYYEQSPRVIKDFNPESKIIIMLRNPVDRVFSHYLMDRCAGLIREDFNILISNEISHFENKKKCWGEEYIYLELGLYYQQVLRYLNLFGKENVHIVFFEEFICDIKRNMVDVFKFLNIDAFFNVVPEKKNVAQLPYFQFITYFKRNALAKKMFNLFPNKMKSSFKERLHTNKNLPEIDLNTALLLRDWYKDDILALGHLLNKDLSLWLR